MADDIRIRVRAPSDLAARDLRDLREEVQRTVQEIERGAERARDEPLVSPGATRQGEEAVRDLREELERTLAAIERGGERTRDDPVVSPSAVRQGEEAVRELREEVQRTVQEVERGAARTDGADLGATRGTNEAATAQDRLQRELRQTRTEASQTNRVLSEIRGTVLAAFSVAAVIRFGRAMVEASLAAERVDRALRAITGSQQLAEREMQFVTDTVDRLGLSLRSTAQQYTGFLAASRGTALEGEAAREVFVGLTEASVALGRSNSETERVLRAVEQIMSKGRVTAEEWRQQLGEALPVANRVLAQALGVTITELNNMVDAGELTVDVLQQLARGLSAEFGKEAEKAAQGAQGAFNRLGNAIDDLLVSLGESGLVDALSTIAGWLSKLGVLVEARLLSFRNLGYAVGVVGAVIDNVRSGRENPIDDALEVYRDLLTTDLERIGVLERTDEASAKAAGAEATRLEGLAALKRRLDAEERKLEDARLGFVEGINQQIEASERAVLDAKRQFLEQGLQLTRQALDEAVRAEQAAADRIAELRQRGADQQRSIADEIRALQRGALPEDQQQGDLERQITGRLIDAREALAGGDTALGETLADEARSLTTSLDDLDRRVALLQEVGRLLGEANAQSISSAEAARNAERQRIAELTELAGGAERALAAINAELRAVTESDPTVELRSNFEQQLELVRELRRELAALQRQSGGGGGGGGSAVPGFATGTVLPGYGGGDRVPAYLEPGEGVVRKEAVRHYGAGLIHALNSLVPRQRLPAIPGAQRFANGGIAQPAAAAPGAAQDMGRLELVVGGRPHAIFAEREVLRSLTDALAEGARAGG